MSQKKVYSIINQKGGVGKTTTTINLGTAMAACDAKVLLIDMDPQGNLSTGLGVSPSKRQFGCYNILTSTKTIDECAIQTEIPNRNSNRTSDRTSDPFSQKHIAIVFAILFPTPFMFFTYFVF